MLLDAGPCQHSLHLGAYVHVYGHGSNCWKAQVTRVNGDDAAAKREEVLVFEGASTSGQAVFAAVIASMQELDQEVGIACSEHGPSLPPAPLASTGHSAGPSAAHKLVGLAGMVVSVDVVLPGVLVGRVTLQTVE